MTHDDDQPSPVEWLDLVDLAELIPQQRRSPENRRPES